MPPDRILPLARAALLIAAALAMSAAAAGEKPSASKLRSAAVIEAALADTGAARVIGVFDEPKALDEAKPAVALRHSASMQRTQDALVAVARGSRAAAAGDVRRLEIEPMLALEVDAAGLARLLADPRVRAVHPDRLSRPFGQPSLKLIGMPPVWRMGGRGQGRIVAVIDSGVDAGHPYLYPRAVGEAFFTSRFKAGRGVHFRPTCPGGATEAKGPGSARPCTSPQCAHGTHVAGIAAGSNPD